MLNRRPRRNKIRRRSRTLPLKGYGDDEGKYYHCWHCGFVCDKDRDALGGAQSRSGTAYRDQVSRAYGPGYLCVDDMYTAMKLNADDSVTIKKAIMPYGGSGCPLCGSLNWRGDY